MHEQNTVLSMLSDAKMPHKFWGEVLLTVAYLQNWSPTKAVKRMTPYEAWTGEMPLNFSFNLVDHLRRDGQMQPPGPLAVPAINLAAPLLEASD